MEIYLKKGKERAIVAGHPWVFSGAVERVNNEGEPGDIGVVKTSSGQIVGYGYYNPSSTICLRMLSLGTERFSRQMLSERIALAVGAREKHFDEKTTAYRLVNSEGDFLPGLVVDRYGSGLCIQLLTAGMRKMRDSIVSDLKKIYDPEFIYERSDSDSVVREKIEPVNEVIHGKLPDELIITENSIAYTVDLAGGQKTGLFLDQRENRALIRKYVPEGIVADCFCYTGGFSLNALKGGARRVISIDASRKALSLAKKNRQLNRFECSEDDFVAASVFGYLRDFEKSFSLVVLDPPKFARHHGERQKAARGYKDVNLMAMRALARGGVLFTFSCSQAVDSSLFRQILFGAAIDAGRKVQLLHTLSQPSDHPVNIAHREGEYLKGLILRVI